MRLTSSIWIAALRRNEEARGGFASVSKKGDEQAGAVYIVHYRLGAQYSLYAQVPQMFLPEDETDRVFELRLDQVPIHEINEWLENQKRMDSDFWVVEVESREEKPMIQVIEVE